MLANLPSILNEICAENVYHSQRDKRKLLMLLDAMQTCIADVCPLQKNQNDKIKELLSSTQSISRDEFCKVIKQYPFQLPRTLRRLESELVKNDIDWKELNQFDSMQTTEEMVQAMMHLKQTLHAQGIGTKSATTFIQLVNIIFAQQASHKHTSSKKLLTAVEAFNYLNDIEDAMVSFTNMTDAAFGILLLNTNDLQVMDQLFHMTKPNEFPTWTIDYTLNALLSWVNYFIQLDATEPVPKAKLEEWNEILEHYIGPIVNEYIVVNSRRNLRWDKLITELKEDNYIPMILNIMQYIHPIQNLPNAFIPSFPNLSEDMIALDSLTENVEMRAFLTKWQKVKRGIISRVWFTKDDITNIKKMRRILTCFPLPFKTGSRSILSLFLETKECKQWSVDTMSSQMPEKRKYIAQMQKILALHKKFSSTKNEKRKIKLLDKITNETNELERQKEQKLLREQKNEKNNNSCGCNCVCSTRLGLMIANEVGLLGSLIHVVMNPNHVFLLAGKREDWIIRNVSHELYVLETTARHESEESEICTQPYSELKSKTYLPDDEILPNIHEFYMMESFRLFQNSNIISYLREFLTSRSTNIFGADLVIRTQVRDSFYSRDVIPMALFKRMQFLLDNEVKNQAKTLDLFLDYVSQKKQTLEDVLSILLSQNSSENLLVDIAGLLYYIRHHPEFGRSSMLWNSIVSLCMDYNVYKQVKQHGKIIKHKNAK